MEDRMRRPALSYAAGITYHLHVTLFYSNEKAGARKIAWHWVLLATSNVSFTASAMYTHTTGLGLRVHTW